jgi:hypothetical protein
MMFQIGKSCDEDFGQTTSVILSGSDGSIAKAKQKIEELLNNFSSGGRSSGNSNGSGLGSDYGTTVVEPESQKPQVIDWAEANRICVSRK